MTVDTRAYREAVDIWLNYQDDLNSSQLEIAAHLQAKPNKPAPERRGTPQEYESLRARVAASRPRSRSAYEHTRADHARRLAPGIEREANRLWAQRNEGTREAKAKYKKDLAEWFRELYTLERKRDAAKGCLSEARELARLEIAPLWHMLITPSQSVRTRPVASGHTLFWRGSILRRHIVDPEALHLLATGCVRLLHVDSFMLGNGVEFTPRFSGAESFALSGFVEDSIQGDLRHDPVVIGFVLEDREWKHDESDPTPSKIALEDKRLCNVTLPFYRAK